MYVCRQWVHLKKYICYKNGITVYLYNIFDKEVSFNFYKSDLIPNHFNENCINFVLLFFIIYLISRNSIGFTVKNGNRKEKVLFLM